VKIKTKLTALFLLLSLYLFWSAELLVSILPEKAVKGIGIKLSIFQRVQ